MLSGESVPENFQWLMVVFAGVSFLLGWWFWIQFGRKTFDISARQFPVFNFGAFAMYLPRKKLWKRDWRTDNAPYFDMEMGGEAIVQTTSSCRQTSELLYCFQIFDNKLNINCIDVSDILHVLWHSFAI